MYYVWKGTKSNKSAKLREAQKQVLFLMALKNNSFNPKMGGGKEFKNPFPAIQD